MGDYDKPTNWRGLSGLSSQSRVVNRFKERDDLIRIIAGVDCLQLGAARIDLVPPARYHLDYCPYSSSYQLLIKIYAEELARQQELDFLITKHDRGSTYFYQQKGDDPVHQIKDSELNLPDYDRFLRIIPGLRDRLKLRDWHKQILGPLESKINELDLPGLEAFITYRYRLNRQRIRQREPLGVEIALTAQYKFEG